MSDTPRNETEALDRLSNAIETLNDQRIIRIQNSTWSILGYQFIRGLAFGLGSVIGATILVSVLVLMLSQIEFIPIIGEWATRIMQEINGARP